MGARPEGGAVDNGVLSLGGEHIDNITGFLNLTTPKYVPVNFYNSSKSGKIELNDLLICKDGALTGKVALVRNELAGKDAMVNEHVFIVRCSEIITQKYLFNFFFSEIGQILLKSNVTGSAQGGLNSTNLKNLKLPIPPLDIQSKIVAECEAVDNEFENSKKIIEDAKAKIEEIMSNVKGEKKRIKDICEAINPSKSTIHDIDDDSFVSFVEMASVSNDGYIETKIDRQYKYVKKGSYTYFGENDIIIAKITPCMENGKCAIAQGLTNAIGFGSSEFHVFRCGASVKNHFLFSFLNREIVRKEASSKMTGASGHRRVPIDFYENMEIPVPSLTEQERIVKMVETEEKKIIDAKAVMASVKERKQAVLDKWL